VAVEKLREAVVLASAGFGPERQVVNKSPGLGIEDVALRAFEWVSGRVELLQARMAAGFSLLAAGLKPVRV